MGGVQVGFVTLFPDMVRHAMAYSVLGRAAEKGLVHVRTSDPREFATDSHRTVDDSPYGGGSGMVMRVDVVAAAIRDLGQAHVVILDPAAPRFTQADARRLSRLPHVTLVCGHYEGIDERVRDALCHEAFSIGDFVLTGGELPALCLADAMVRLVPGVLGDQQSHEEDSFEDGLLGYPQYTRPAEWEGHRVPEILASGDHRKVAEWRRTRQIERTKQHRPDLLVKADLTAADLAVLSSLAQSAVEATLPGPPSE